MTKQIALIFATLLVTVTLFAATATDFFDQTKPIPGVKNGWTDGTTSWQGNPFCKEAGFIPSPTSQVLAKNWKPGGELPKPPWHDIDGEVISYIGACGPLDNPEPPLVAPAVPGNFNLK